MSIYSFAQKEPAGSTINDQNTNSATSFGLAGSDPDSGLRFRYCNINLNLKFEIDSNSYLWMILNESGIQSTISVTNTYISSSNYNCIYYISSKPFTLKLDPIDGNITGYPAEQDKLWESQFEVTVPASYYTPGGLSVGDFNWSPLTQNRISQLSGPKIPLGDAYDVFEWDPSSDYTGTGYLYLGGTSWGYGTTSQTGVRNIEAVRLKFNGIRNYIDYFPGAIYDTRGNLNSCNRSGGYFRKLSRSSYQNKRNIESSASNSTVVIHNGSGFNVVAPLIGDV